MIGQAEQSRSLKRGAEMADPAYSDTIHPAAIEHLPIFITAPGQTDWLFNVTIVIILAIILILGNFYFQLHALPERMAHRGKKVQMEIVAALALISLFTHNHIFWIIGLLLALIDLPDFSSPMSSIARSLEKLSGRDPAAEDRAEEQVEEQAIMRPGPEQKIDAVDGSIRHA
jgi:hypothetical protein